MATALSTPGALRMDVLATQIDEPEIAQAVRETQSPPIRAHLQALLAQALGADHPDLDLLADIGLALIWYRMVMMGETTDPAQLAVQIAALVLPPADTRTDN